MNDEAVFKEELEQSLNEINDKRIAEADMMEQDLRNVREALRQLIRQAQVLIDYITDHLPTSRNIS